MMKKLFVVIILLMVAPVSNAYDLISDLYFYPISAKVSGSAGTNWKTELCLTNPWDDRSVTITAMIVQDGYYVAGTIRINPFSTICAYDLYALIGVSNGDGMVFLEGNRPFATAMFIYNDTPNGKYGQNVPFLTGEDAVPTPNDICGVVGLHNYGSPGFSGVRSNYGVANLGATAETMSVIVSGDGGLYRTYNVTVPPFSVHQWRVTDSFEIGALIFHSYSPYLLPYASVVDNQTSDAAFRWPIIARGMALKSTPAGETIRERWQSIKGTLKELETTNR
jgi:hypothetical protein